MWRVYIDWLRRSLPLVLSASLTWSLTVSWASTGGGPENVILAVNQNSPASLAVANLYIELRQIPPSNVVYLDLPFAADQEQITLAEFRDKILQPIIAQIQARHLESQIDYIIYSADFPTAITVNDAVKTLQKDQPDLSPDLIKLMRPTASINSLTYFAGAVLGNNISYLSLDSNWYMRLSIEDALRSPFQVGDERSFRSAQVMIHAGEYEQALKFLEPLAQANPRQFATWLEILRCHAGLGHPQESIAAIQNLAGSGWGHRATISEMKEFQKIAGDADVKKALETIPNESPDYVSSHGFRRIYLWGKNGGLNSQPEQGRSYILSTVLAVTRNNGTSLADALKYLRVSAAADFSHPQGDFYFSLTGDVRTTTRQPGFDGAIAGLKQLGYNGVITKERVPANRKQVLGALLGEKSAQWPPSLSEMVPGAIVDNLTSFGGRMKGDHHTPATEFLKWGAAGSSGTVIEPFAIQAKFAHPMILVHYARGCSLAEAYYQSVHGPFQLLIVGDALCQPWASPVPFEAIGLDAGDQVSGNVSVQVRTEDAAKIAHYELYLDGVRSGITPRVGKFSFDADKISDGFHELRIVAIATGPLETQSRKIIPFIVDHDREAVQLTLDQSQISQAGEIEVTAHAPTANAITIYQNGRSLGSVSKSGESIRIHGSTLGMGKSQLIAAASIEGQLVQSEPVTVVVQ